MERRTDPVTADDVAGATEAAVAALSTRLDRDWHVPAGPLQWDCWETVEHVSDDLFAYAAQLAPRPPGNDGGDPVRLPAASSGRSGQHRLRGP